jgi:fucose permease
MFSNFRGISAYVWFQVAVACLSLFALGWMDNARGPFFPILLSETSASSSEGSLFFALTSFVAIISSALASRFISLFGLKSLLILGGALMTASPFGLVFLPDLFGALITAFLFGASLGFVAVGQNVLVGRIENEEFKRRFFSLLHCFYALAAMTAPLTVLVLKGYVQWNQILVGVSFLSIPFMFLVFFLKNDSVEKNSSNFEIELTPPKWTDKTSFLWILFMSFYVASELILSTRMVVLVKSFDFSFDQASHHLFYFFLFMLCSRLLFFVVQFNSPAFKVLLLCVSGGLISSILGYAINPIFFSIVGGFMGPVFPTVMEVLSKTWPKKFDLVVSRVISLSSFFVVLAHMSVGRLTDLYGIQNSLIVVPVFLSISLLILIYRQKKLV